MCRLFSLRRSSPKPLPQHAKNIAIAMIPKSSTVADDGTDGHPVYEAHEDADRAEEDGCGCDIHVTFEERGGALWCFNEIVLVFRWRAYRLYRCG